MPGPTSGPVSQLTVAAARSRFGSAPQVFLSIHRLIRASFPSFEVVMKVQLTLDFPRVDLLGQLTARQRIARARRPACRRTDRIPAATEITPEIMARGIVLSQHYTSGGYTHVTFNHGVEGSSPSALTKNTKYIKNLPNILKRVLYLMQLEMPVRLHLDCTVTR